MSLGLVYLHSLKVVHGDLKAVGPFSIANVRTSDRNISVAKCAHR
jgi:hypothetical protein